MSDAPAAAPRAAGWLPLVGSYGLYFGAVGILLPFLPAYLRSLSLSGAQVGALLALSPLMSLVAPPLFGHWADRTGRVDRVLRVLAFGALLGLAPLTAVDTLAGAALAMGLYAFFASSMTSMMDALALQRVALEGGSYARLRLFGSLGFVLSSALFGLAADTLDRTTVVVAVGFVAAYAAWSLTLRSQAVPSQRRGVFAAWGLLRQRDIAWLLTATALHWLACAPYHGSISIHVTVGLSLPPWVVGLGAGIGVVAEIAVMYLYPAVAHRLSPRWVLAIAFAGSALRWWGMAVARTAGPILALSLLHGLTFGAFYVAAIAAIARRVPPHERASGQALFASVTFGVGGLLGYLSAGAAYDWLGGHRLFAVAGVLEVVAAAIALGVPPAPEPEAPSHGE